MSAEQLAAAATSLSSAVAAGGAELPEAPRERVSAVVEKVGQRTAMVGNRTVVALAGATGSGKSSLFNALVGADVSAVGVRRPTTSTATAAVWGEEPSGDLLAWLGVGTRHVVEPVGADGTGEPDKGGSHVGTLDGLVLLDLPDFDSRENSHRLEAERVLELVDLFVWVTDPQKYADARLHDDYVAALATHEAVTMVVLNQSDRLTHDQVEQCRADLVRLMDRDGMPRATVLAASARTGDGVDVLRQRLANAVASRTMSRARLAGDIRSAAASLTPHVAAEEAAIGK
ncbi:MAG: YfjP family GTPase, partial [Ornithinibacter sp.]